MTLIHIYRQPGPSAPALIRKAHEAGISSLVEVKSEYCFNVALSDTDATLPEDQKAKLMWLFTETFEPDNTSDASSFISLEMERTENAGVNLTILEVGPRLAFSTAWSSNCISMCEACGITAVSRIERSRRYLLYSSSPLNEEMQAAFASLVHDRMTECVYNTPLETFESDSLPAGVAVIPILEQGAAALEALNEQIGLGFDEWDVNFYTKMFTDTLGRNPTDVECFDLGQSNSEHSRHWFFGGKMILDDIEQSETLFGMVKSTLPATSNSIIAFHDNSSSIQGFEVETLLPIDGTTASSMQSCTLTLHPILTAETHNFPTGVAPFCGAETGTGGRLRDVQATGRGAHTVAGVSAYCVGNLNIPGYVLPWEEENPQLASNLANPLTIEIDASNGASDYGNKYGEPVICGFNRAFGQRLPNGERYEFLKPIMFTAGIGSLDSRHAVKGQPEVGMIVCKIGGPAYRIGMGGGAASSRLQGTADAALDFNAVQRGDAEMENRLNRVIRACVEMGDNNPIISIHDQGAGGNGNVLKELVDPLGAEYQLRSIPVGDKTLSPLEIWGAEYQENNAFLIREECLEKVLVLAKRENCPVTAVGKVTGNGRVTVVDGDGSIPFDLPLSLVLGKMPQKTFTFTSPIVQLEPLKFPIALAIPVALDRVLRLLDVGSKRFLTNKVDRSVTGLIAQQQCVGPLHTPLANVGVVAHSHFSLTGTAVSVGEQPIKGLISPAAQARMSVGEALTNMCWAKITAIEDIKASGNWMWAAKLPGEGKKMWDACVALRDCLKILGPSIDGGKDSLSMAARVGSEVVKSPGQLTMTCYAACTDITKTVTPNLKYPDNSVLLYIDLGGGKCRLGGTALSTVYGQLGNSCADLDDPVLLSKTFNVIQSLLDKRAIAAGHDRSDGGLIVTVLEMAFAGNCGIQLNIAKVEGKTPLEILFSEELGLVLEVHFEKLEIATTALKEAGIPYEEIGVTRKNMLIDVSVGGFHVLGPISMTELRDTWESTSFQLERLQCNPRCVDAEQHSMQHRLGPTYNLTFTPTPTPQEIITAAADTKPRVAVIRQEGSNGDREMIAAFFMAGFDAWDVNMVDLLDGRVNLDDFRGVVFVGGFSYADVNDSAKGWAGVIRYNPALLAMFETFRTRKNTFSLGICNGCQLMALLGWVPFPVEFCVTQGGSSSVLEHEQPRFVHNESGRFESRWSTVVINNSPSVLLKGMEGCTLGVWVAHGEGRALFPNPKHLEKVLLENLAPIRYVSDKNIPTEAYPMNPNGSPHGIAGLCSSDGRHLALMPHPERCVLTWQCPHLPNTWRHHKAGAWLKLFQNAYEFCLANE